MYMKIAILYICTGKYRRFFKDFYESAEKYLLSNTEKHYFVWTDDDDLANNLINVTINHRECAGFPADSLFRFEMFMQVEEQLKKYDYIYFFNSNALFLKFVGKEILPDDTGLAVGIWRGIREKQPPMLYPYERNKQSLAYIAPYHPPYVYFMGGLNGGTSVRYLEMIRTLSNNIRNDYNRGIIAKCHDESHINAYLRTHPCKIISEDLNLPEEAMSVDSKIIFREKTHLDPYFNKNRKFTKSARIKKGCVIVWDILRWYFKF